MRVGRRTIAVLAAVVVLLMAACAGMAWWVVRNIDGDGLSEIDD